MNSPTAADGLPVNLPANSPQMQAIRTAQQKDLSTLQTTSAGADAALDTATQLYNAANGIYTGRGAGSWQNFRKSLQAAGTALGVPVPDDVNDATSKFEQLKYVSQQLVAKASHDVNPRVSAMIYNQIGAVKPGDQSSVKGLGDIITKQIMPILMRERALYGAASNYYQNNPRAQDALAKVPDSVPLGQFTVKSVNTAQPGDYYTDPVTGNIRQRPAQ